MTLPQSRRDSGSFQSRPQNQDFGGRRFGGNREGSMTMPQSRRDTGSFQSPPPNRDFGGRRFGGNREGSMTMPQSRPDSGGFQSPPPNRDFGGRRFGGNREGSMAMPQSGPSGGSRHGFGSREAAPMISAPRQPSPQAFDRSAGRHSFSGGGSPSVRSAPSFSENGRGMRSAPPSGGFSGGRSNDGGGSHRGRRER